MFHRKPLYVAIAQRKEDRQAQLQLHYAQRMAGLAGPSTPVIPGGYPPLYYTAPPGVIPPRQGLMYQPLGLRTGWRANNLIPPTRPAFQPSSIPLVNSKYHVLYYKFSADSWTNSSPDCMHSFCHFALFYGLDSVKSSAVAVKIIIVDSFRKVNKYFVYAIVFNG